MLEWIVIGGVVVALYLVIYKYEKKMERMQKIIDAHAEQIDKNQDKIKHHNKKIDKNVSRLDEHYNHLEKLWVAAPHKHTKSKKQKEE